MLPYCCKASEGTQRADYAKASFFLSVSTFLRNVRGIWRLISISMDSIFGYQVMFGVLRGQDSNFTLYVVLLRVDISFKMVRHFLRQGQYNFL